MGLERLASMAQGFSSNYDSDLFAPLLAEISRLVGKPYGRSDSEDDISMRVIADHARSTAFLIADGVLPANEGRGYVLRRVMRRAIRHGKKLGFDTNFLYKAALFVVDAMEGDYPELRRSRETIEKYASLEESRFRETIDAGLKLLGENSEWATKDGARVLPGKVAFVLHDTYGFPLDLVEVIGAEQGFEVDHAGFEAAMNEQRTRSRAASSFATGPKGEAGPYRAALAEVGATRFTGYDGVEGEGEIVALIVDGKPAKVAHAGDKVEVIASKTPFYAESGGQIGDSGTITGKGFVLHVDDTQKPVPDLFVHRGEVKVGEVKVGDGVQMHVDAQRRQNIRNNHSATHLAHWALRAVLGEHVKQSGSLVSPDRLRFDFSHFGPMTETELEKVETLVNEKIRENHDATVEELPIESARQKGAIAMFGEKYGDVVRVVSIAPESVEFCGGTHVRRSGDIGLFRITREEGVAAGVRRLEAVTGSGALAYVHKTQEALAKAGSLLKVNPFEVAERVERLLAEQKRLEKELDALKKKAQAQRSADVMSDVQEVLGVKVLAVRAESGDAKSLRDFGDKLRDQMKSGVIVVGGVDGEKVTVLAMVTPDLVGRFHAGKLVGELAKLVGGKGGGKPEMAQGGGNDPSKLDEALAKVPSLLS